MLQHSFCLVCIMIFSPCLHGHFFFFLQSPHGIDFAHSLEIKGDHPSPPTFLCLCLICPPYSLLTLFAPGKRSVKFDPNIVERRLCSHFFISELTMQSSLHNAQSCLLHRLLQAIKESRAAIKASQAQVRSG